MVVDRTGTVQDVEFPAGNLYRFFHTVNDAQYAAVFHIGGNKDNVFTLLQLRTCGRAVPFFLFGGRCRHQFFRLFDKGIVGKGIAGERDGGEGGYCGEGTTKRMFHSLFLLS